MKAIRIDGQTPGGSRVCLADVIPLNTPFSLQIFPIYACNLACNYCIHSLSIKERGFVSEKSLLDYELYKKCIDELKLFPEKLKMLRFAGTGEPLLHKNIVSMIRYAKEKKIAESIDIVTNGLLLTNEMSLSLVEAGIDKIRISIQGLDDHAYAYTKQKGIFSKFVDNIRFLYEHRKKTKIYIKIIDCALKDDQEKNFLDIFGNICDFIAVEHLIPAVGRIDYEKIAGQPLDEITQNGTNIQKVEVCPQAFYMMQLNPDGKVVPCCSMETAYILGDIELNSLFEIWQGKSLYNFRVMQLLKKKSTYSVCKQCLQYQYAMFEEDCLDDDTENLLKKLEDERAYESNKN